MAWNTVLPRLGTRCVNVRVSYRVSYARAKQRMATENWGAHQGGGQAVIQDDSALGPSDGDPVYNASYCYRGEALRNPTFIWIVCSRTKACATEGALVILGKPC